MFIYIILATAFVISVLVKHEVNYMYIFELDPLAKMNHHQLLKVGMVLSFFWSICFAMSLMQARLDYIFGQQPLWFLFVLAIFFIVYCC